MPMPRGARQGGQAAQGVQGAAAQGHLGVLVSMDLDAFEAEVVDPVSDRCRISIGMGNDDAEGRFGRLHDHLLGGADYRGGEDKDHGNKD